MISLRRLAIPLALVLVGATTTVAAADVREFPKVVASCDQKVEPGHFTCFAQRRHIWASSKTNGRRMPPLTTTRTGWSFVSTVRHQAQRGTGT